MKTLVAEITLLLQFYPGQPVKIDFFVKKRIVHCYLDKLPWKKLVASKIWGHHLKKDLGLAPLVNVLVGIVEGSSSWHYILATRSWMLHWEGLRCFVGFFFVDFIFQVVYSRNWIVSWSEGLVLPSPACSDAEKK